MSGLTLFFERRDAPSRKFRCGCCGGAFDRDEHMGDAFTEAHTAAVIDEYGPDVCFGCADAFEPDFPCVYCGHEVCTCDDAYENAVSERLHEEFGA